MNHDYMVYSAYIRPSMEVYSAYAIYTTCTSIWKLPPLVYIYIRVVHCPISGVRFATTLVSYSLLV